MHKLFAIILAFISMLLVLTRKGIAAWSNLDPTTSDFTTANMIPGYKDGGSRQWGEKIVKNTGYNYDQVIARWNEKGWAWKNAVPAGGEVKFATSIIFTDFYWAFWEEFGDLEGDETVKIRYLTANYQEFFQSNEIKALAGGGFQIRNNAASIRSYKLAFLKIQSHGEGITV